MALGGFTRRMAPAKNVSGIPTAVDYVSVKTSGAPARHIPAVNKMRCWVRRPSRSCARWRLYEAALARPEARMLPWAAPRPGPGACPPRSSLRCPRASRHLACRGEALSWRHRRGVSGVFCGASWVAGPAIGLVCGRVCA